MYAGFDDHLVELRHLVERGRRVARNDLENSGQRMFTVAGVDALGRIGDEEIFLPLHARFALQHRNADLFGRTRIDRRLIDNGGASLHMPADAGTGADQRAEVGNMGQINRRGHGDDDHIGLGQDGRVGAVDRVSGRTHLLVAELARRVQAALAGRDLDRREIETDGAQLFAELHHQGQAHIAQTDHRYCICHLNFH